MRRGRWSWREGGERQGGLWGCRGAFPVAVRESGGPRDRCAWTLAPQAPSPGCRLPLAPRTEWPQICSSDKSGDAEATGCGTGAPTLRRLSPRWGGASTGTVATPGLGS